MGAEAVLALIDATRESHALVIALDGNQIVRKNLMECVQKVNYSSFSCVAYYASY